MTGKHVDPNPRYRWCAYCTCRSDEDHYGYCLTQMEYAIPDWLDYDPARPPITAPIDLDPGRDY
jgi:hypothetical protein